MNRIVSYIVGLTLALVLTLAAFSITFAYLNSSVGALSHAILIATILALAMAQLAVQLVFFLHFGQGKDAQWSVWLFTFTFFGILVVVLATVWIMGHLNYNMTPMQIDQYTVDQSSF